MATCPDCLTHYPTGTHACAKDGRALLVDDAAAAADPFLEQGSMVGEYRVEALVGIGGFGRVYRAVHPLIGKTVAVKVLSRRFSADETIVARFVDEARAVNVIRHPNIIDIFAFGALPDGRHYYVMEFLHGTTLQDYLGDDGALDTPVALGILGGVARALGAAHGASIAHRDLKPDNVFLVRSERDVAVQVKLLDFGIAKLLGEAVSASRTSTGSPLGTPDYMSPEQCRGRSVDHRADIYAFGLLAFRLLAGGPPFDGESAIDVLFMQVNTPAPRMSEVNPAVPAVLDGPVLHMLEKDPDNRPPSIAAAMAELLAAAAAAGLDAAPAPATVLAPPPRDPSRANLVTDTASTASRTAGSTAAGETQAALRERRLRAGGVAFVAVALFALGIVRGALAPVAPSEAAATQAVTAANAPPIAEPSAVAPAPNAVAVVATVPSAATVSLVVQTRPEACELYLGDARLGVAPGPFVLPRGDAPLALSVRAPGHKPATLTFVPRSNGTEKVELARVPRASPAKDAATSSPKRTPSDLERPF
jgi:eukaryotic-like serine/threonine-protein kinase